MHSRWSLLCPGKPSFTPSLLLSDAFCSSSSPVWCLLYIAPVHPQPPPFLPPLALQNCCIGHWDHLCRLLAVLTLSLIPRSITMALALPIAAQLGASPGIVAAGVMITGAPSLYLLVLLASLKSRTQCQHCMSMAPACHPMLECHLRYDGVPYRLEVTEAEAMHTRQQRPPQLCQCMVLTLPWNLDARARTGYSCLIAASNVLTYVCLHYKHHINHRSVTLLCSEKHMLSGVQLGFAPSELKLG